MERLQQSLIEKDVQKKLVFLVGPRQVGKTWLANRIKMGRTLYLNYDRVQDREIIKNESWIESEIDLLILDELHKMPSWKTFIKGIYDTKAPHLKILVTGSARLDLFRQLGDSLAGRVYVHHILPLSLKELAGSLFENNLERLLERGGFPEPFLAETTLESERWRKQYVDGLIAEDIHEYKQIKFLKSIRLLLELLTHRVGSPISYMSLGEDLQLSPNTIKHYIDILESLFIIFRITPYSKNISRSLLKEPKIYFFDTGLLPDNKGMRFENLMAVSLLKHSLALSDYEGKACELHYLRTKDGVEVDFCVVINGKPVSMIEAKLSQDKLHPGIVTLYKKYGIPGYQVVAHLKRSRQEKGIQILSAHSFLESLHI